MRADVGQAAQRALAVAREEERLVEQPGSSVRGASVPGAMTSARSPSHCHVRPKTRSIVTA